MLVIQHFKILNDGQSIQRFYTNGKVITFISNLLNNLPEVMFRDFVDKIPHSVKNAYFANLAWSNIDTLITSFGTLAAK